MSSARTFETEFSEICAMDGPLHERLEAITRIIAQHDPEFSTAYQVLVGQLRAAECGKAAPEVGSSLPPFLLLEQNCQLVSLESLLGDGPVVISLNRGYWCEYCEIELRAYSSAHAEFAAYGAKVVSIMPDRLEYIAMVRERSKYAFLVLCDLDSSYALQLNLVIWLGDQIRDLLSKSGVMLERVQANRSSFVPIPATFVLDEGGLIVARFVDPDFRKRMDVADVLDAIGKLPKNLRS